MDGVRRVRPGKCMGAREFAGRPILETARHRAAQFVPEGRPLIPYRLDFEILCRLDEALGAVMIDSGS